MQDHLLSLNDFQNPKILDGYDADYMHIIKLLLTEPGLYQTHPKMGIGLRSRYRYNNGASLLQNLQNDIKDQIRTYLPELTATDITVTLGKTYSLGIIINTGEGAYILSYNNEDDKISVGNEARYVLSDL